MKACKKCETQKTEKDFYSKDSTCKECRKEMVRANRAKNIEYYKEYDKKRFKEDPRVRERHRIYQATDNGKKALRKSSIKWIKTNPVKRAANIIVGNHVRDGKILKPSFCSECGSSGRIHGHHDDYAYPLIVRWLCSGCHTAWHKENGEGLNAR